MSESRKRPLIFFSGGLDSTYLLYTHLKEGENVDIAYADGMQHPIKRYAEEKARVKIIHAIQRGTPGRVVNDHYIPHIRPMADISINGTGRGTTPEENYWVQPMSWFLAAFWAVSAQVHSSVEIGLVLGDDGLLICHDMQTAWRSLAQALMPQCTDFPPLLYPIRLKSKEAILKELPESIQKHVWYCETPLWQRNRPIACGKCRPCLSHDKERQCLEAGNTLDMKAIDKFNTYQEKQRAKSERTRQTAETDVSPMEKGTLQGPSGKRLR